MDIDRAPRRDARKAPGERPPTIVLAVLLLVTLLAVRLWIVEPLTVASDSMEPAVAQYSTVLMLKPFSREQVAPGALIVFISPEGGTPTLKRVVAVGGQTVAIEDSILLVDGEPMPEPGIDHTRIDGTYFGPVQVPESHVFVLGDNRAGSIDSRDYGSIPLEALLGVVLWP
ncbi:signal peptidase I [Arthrobacter sp. H41]|uniref:signal peptidase I n=1 Tax=Arthrobacter sp. H41 TaxID=1312978 RepID=UPI0004B727A1|nr:signal peptidase I [Arthrobacter sp. H41]